MRWPWPKRWLWAPEAPDPHEAVVAEAVASAQRQRENSRSFVRSLVLHIDAGEPFYLNGLAERVDTAKQEERRWNGRSRS